MTKISKMLPAMGFVIAAALVAITSAFKEAPKSKSVATLYTFQYNPPASEPYSVAHVEDESRWSYTADADPCSGDDVEACKIKVPETYVNNPTGSSPTLKSTADIVATESSTGISYVSSTAAGNSGTISNKFE